MKINTETHAIDFEVKDIFTQLKRHGIKRKDIVSSSIWRNKERIRINFCRPHKEDKYVLLDAENWHNPSWYEMLYDFPETRTINTNTITVNNYLNNDAYYVTNTTFNYINTHITPQEYEIRYANTTATNTETNNHAVAWVEHLRRAYRGSDNSYETYKIFF